MTDDTVPPVPVRGLFEAHLTVSDLQRSITFYRDTNNEVHHDYISKINIKK